jgi:hypothetical protein|tara:strand:+ start:2616 stop:2876 length:261 start_codon:yes stop_codon:yes gene_type:complete
MATKKLSMSERLRRAMTKLQNQGWDLGTCSYADIVAVARKNLKGDAKAAFAPTAAQVSIVKREFTGGSPSGERGRPSHASVGIEAA